MARLNHFNRLAFLDFVESGGLDGPDYLPATEIAERTKRHHIMPRLGRLTTKKIAQFCGEYYRKGLLERRGSEYGDKRTFIYRRAR